MRNRRWFGLPSGALALAVTGACDRLPARHSSAHGKVLCPGMEGDRE